MRHAIVGAGFGVVAHLPAFGGVPGVQVVALADSGSGRAARFAQPPLVAYSDWQCMLDEVRPDTLSVTVPPLMQREVVVAALSRGIHVLCEKPVGMGPSDVEVIARSAAQAGKNVAVTYQYRFEPGLAALREQVRGGRLGSIRRIDFAWITAGRADPARPWSWQHDAAQGGGVLNAFLPHVIDLIVWLAGSHIVRAVGRTDVLIPVRTDANGVSRQVSAEDLVDALLELDCGALANVRVTNCQRGGEGMRIEIHGDQGTLLFINRPPFDGPQIVEYRWHDNNTEPVPFATATDGETDTRVLPLKRLASVFVSAARGGKEENLPTCADALHVQSVITALRASCASGQFQAVQARYG